MYSKGTPITANRAANLYVLEASSIAIYERGVKQRAFPVDLRWHAPTVIAIDIATGAERWRAPAWHPTRTVFASDGTSVAVLAEGGLLALDAATGKQLASACGWGFGLSRARPRGGVLGSPVACAAE